MLVTVGGISDVNFKSPEGKEIRGTSIYVSYAHERVVGLKTEKFFLNPNVSLPTGLQPGDEVELTFNRYGKVETVTSAE